MKSLPNSFLLFCCIICNTFMWCLYLSLWRCYTKLPEHLFQHWPPTFLSFCLSQVQPVCSGKPPGDTREWSLHHLHPAAQGPVVQMWRCHHHKGQHQGCPGQWRVSRSHHWAVTSCCQHFYLNLIFCWENRFSDVLCFCHCLFRSSWKTLHWKKCHSHPFIDVTKYLASVFLTDCWQ